MNYSKQTTSYAKELVSNYATFDKYSQTYSIDIDDMPDFDVHALCTLIMNDDESLASEANSVDNPAYEKTMYPALIQYMKDTTNRDNEIEFTKAWRDGVASYFTKTIQELLDELCIDRTNSDYGNAELYSRHRSDNGERYWSGHL